MKNNEIKVNTFLGFVTYFVLRCLVVIQLGADSKHSNLPAQLISGAVVAQAEAVGFACSFLDFYILLIGARWDNGFPPALPAQSVRAGTEEKSKAVLLWHALQEAPQGFVAFLPVTAVVRGSCPLGTGYNIFWPQGSTFLIQATVLSCLQTLVLTIHRKSWSWR